MSGGHVAWSGRVWWSGLVGWLGRMAGSGGWVGWLGRVVGLGGRVRWLDKFERTLHSRRAEALLSLTKTRATKIK